MTEVPRATTPWTDGTHKRPAGKTFLEVLPRRLVKYRELRQVTQAKLAAAAGVARSTLNAIESGQARDVKVTTLERLCHALGVSADALLGYNSVDLVRRPKLHGLNPDLGHDKALTPPHTCPTCGQSIAARALHLPGDCMVELSDHGATNARIGAVFGLTSPTVAFALREAHTARRHRRF